MTYSSADAQAFQRFSASRPILTGCCRLSDVVAIPDGTLLHAGPSYSRIEDIVAPVMNSAVLAAIFEGWAGERAEAQLMILDGHLKLRAAQDYNVVTPLAFVVSPSMSVLCAEDRCSFGSRIFSPVNDGPPDGAARFGSPNSLSLQRLELIKNLTPDLSRCLADPVDMLEAMSFGIANGDDLHGRVTAANELLRSRLIERSSLRTAQYINLCGQFALNPIMAACGVMLSAANGVDDSGFVVGAGANGRSFGWRISRSPSEWRTHNAAVPVGERFDIRATALPAIGDSAVIDACGFGAAALRYNSELRTIPQLFGQHYFTEEASHQFFGRHENFPADLRLGIVATSPGTPLGVMLAALDADGNAGLVGRGISPCLLQ